MHQAKIPSRKNTDPARATDLLVPNPKLRLREQVHEVMRFKHYSVRTEEPYPGPLPQETENVQRSGPDFQRVES